MNSPYPVVDHVKTGLLVPGGAGYAVQFMDEAMTVPAAEPLVMGWNREATGRANRERRDQSPRRQAERLR